MWHTRDKPEFVPLPRPTDNERFPWGVDRQQRTVPIRLTVLGVPMVHESMLAEAQSENVKLRERITQLVAGGSLQRRRQLENDINEALDRLEASNRTGAHTQFLEDHNRTVIDDDL